MTKFDNTLTRRGFVLGSVASGATMYLANCAGDPPEIKPFAQSLRLPSENRGELVDGVRVFALEARASTYEFFSGKPAPTLGINGSLLGPTLRVRRGEDVRIEVTNSLDEDMTLHWHGMHLPAAMDGGPHQVIKPGTTWKASFVVNQKAATNWYHPHTMEKTAEQVYFGLAGFLIIDDDESDALDLPRSYGEDDFPLVLQDRNFDSDGTLVYDPGRRERMRGYTGDTFLVNGTISPTLQVPAKQIRLRILNGSNARIYTLVLDDARAFEVMGADNSLLEQPVQSKELILSPGERIEVLLDLSNDEGKRLVLRDAGSGNDVMAFEMVPSALAATVMPARLATLTRLDAKDAVRTRQFVLSMSRGEFYINDASMRLDTINETLTLDEVEIWEISNTSGMWHNFHMHATHFEILDKSFEAPRPWELAYKDTVLLPPGESVRVLVKMTDYADTTLPYMYHCHFLEHEDAGMMGQFVVRSA